MLLNFVSCCNQRPQTPSSRFTLELIRENQDRLRNNINNLVAPVDEKQDLVVEVLPTEIKGQTGLDKNIGPLEIFGNAGGDINLNNHNLNSLGLGSLGGFLPGQNLVDWVTALNGWKNMSLDARALVDIFSRGIFIPFGNFTLGVHTGGNKTALPTTTRPSTTTSKPCPTAAPHKCQCGTFPCSCRKPCQCGTFPCTCNTIPQKPCQCGTSPCTCNKTTQKPCQCGTFPCTCNKTTQKPCQCGTFPCTCNNKTTPKPCGCGTFPCTCNKIPKETSGNEVVKEKQRENSEEIKFEAVGSLLSYLKKKAATANCN